MAAIYAAQKRFFRKAYESGRHGWPSEGATPEVAALLAKLGPGRGRTALDLGCGEGRHTVLLAKRGWTATGLDYDEGALAGARRALRAAGVSATLSSGDALSLDFADGSFDLALDYGCFHHVVSRDWGRYRRGLARVLKPGGHLILSVFSTKFRHHPGERRTRNWLVHRGHYDRFFSKGEVGRILRESFDTRASLEEHEGLNGFHHTLLRRKG